jgi:hypothetical protein
MYAGFAWSKNLFYNNKNQFICYARKKLTAQNNSFRRPWPRVSLRLRGASSSPHSPAFHRANKDFRAAAKK